MAIDIINAWSYGDINLEHIEESYALNYLDITTEQLGNVFHRESAPPGFEEISR
jgi:hypothetical protein